MFRRLFRHFVVTTKTTQPRLRVFTVNGPIACYQLHFGRHFDVIGSLWLNYFQTWSTVAAKSPFPSEKYLDSTFISFCSGAVEVHEK